MLYCTAEAIGTSTTVNIKVIFHYLIALNIEIIIKISRASAQNYKKRVLMYHIVSIAMTIILLFVVISVQDFKFHVGILIKNELAFNLVVWYMGALSMVAWACVGVYCKYMINLRSTSLLNLILVTCFANISYMVGSIIPQILYYCNVYYQGNDQINFILQCGYSSLGIVEFFFLILNRKSIRDIKRIVAKLKYRERKGKEDRNRC